MGADNPRFIPSSPLVSYAWNHEFWRLSQKYHPAIFTSDAGAQMYWSDLSHHCSRCCEPSGPRRQISDVETRLRAAPSRMACRRGPRSGYLFPFGATSSSPSFVADEFWEAGATHGIPVTGRISSFSCPNPALESLQIETIEYAPAFFQFLSKCSLEKFTIFLRGYSVPYTNETAKNCWSALATHCSHSSLQKIYFQMEQYFGTADSGRGHILDQRRHPSPALSLPIPRQVRPGTPSGIRSRRCCGPRYGPRLAERPIIIAFVAFSIYPAPRNPCGYLRYRTALSASATARHHLRRHRYPGTQTRGALPHRTVRTRCRVFAHRRSI